MDLGLNDRYPEAVAIDILGLPTLLLNNGIDEHTWQTVLERYAAFRVQPQPHMPAVEISVEPGDYYFPINPKASRIVTTMESGYIRFVSYLEKGWYDCTAGRGALVMRPNGNPENYLRVVYAWRCLEVDALLLHAGGVLRGGKGYVFFGPSGSGKTTSVRLSPGATVLSDDLVILKITRPAAAPNSPAEVTLYGVPFRGEMIEAPRTNACGPLAGIFTLHKDSVHRLQDTPRHEAVGRLAACVPFVMTQPPNAQRVLELCDRITRIVPVRSLYFRRDPGFWELIDG